MVSFGLGFGRVLGLEREALEGSGVNGLSSDPNSGILGKGCGGSMFVRDWGMLENESIFIVVCVISVRVGFLLVSSWRRAASLNFWMEVSMMVYLVLKGAVASVADRFSNKDSPRPRFLI
jgi:hypothetical protein